MTEALRDLIGPDYYDTLVRGLNVMHGDWLERKKIPGHRDPWRLITQEGVDALGSWTEAELDTLSGIGPVKVDRMYKALQQLKGNNGMCVDEDGETLFRSDALYFPE